MVHLVFANLQVYAALAGSAVCKGVKAIARDLWGALWVLPPSHAPHCLLQAQHGWSYDPTHLGEGQAKEPCQESGTTMLNTAMPEG